MTAINHECKFTLPNQPETLKRGLSSARLQAITLGEEQYIAKQVENHEPLDKIYSITQKAIHSALRNIRYGYYSLPNSSILPMRTCNGCKTETCSLTKKIESPTLADLVQSTNTQKLTDAQIVRFKILDTLQGQGMFRQRQSTNQQTWSPYLYASVEIFSKLPNKLSSFLDPNNSIDILKTCIDYLLSAPNENIAGIFPRDLNGNNIFANGRIIDQDILIGSPCLVAAKMAFSPIGMIGESAHDNKILSMDEEFFSDFSEIYHESRQAILLTIYNLMVIELLKSSYRSLGKVDKQVTENTINGAIYYYHKITSIENQFVTVMPNVIFSTTE